MAWTEEQRQKMAASWTPERKAHMRAVRMAQVEKQRQKAVAKAQKMLAAEDEPETVTVIAHRSNGKQPPFDWENSPLVDIINRLADMKREYDRCAQIVLRRQSPQLSMYKCWTVETSRHPDHPPPRDILRQCVRDIPDGKEKYRDDGAFDIVNGIKLRNTVRCCSMLCHQFYTSLKPIGALSRH